MSDRNTQYEAQDSSTLAWYKQEPWLAVCVSCFLPVLLAIFTPLYLKIPLIALSGVLLVISMAMLVRQMRAK